MRMQLASQYGKVIQSKIFNSKAADANGDVKNCFALIQFADVTAMELAMTSLHQKNYQGRVLRVEKVSESHLTSSAEKLAREKHVAEAASTMSTSPAPTPTPEPVVTTTTTTSAAPKRKEPIHAPESSSSEGQRAKRRAIEAPVRSRSRSRGGGGEPRSSRKPITFDREEESNRDSRRTIAAAPPARTSRMARSPLRAPLRAARGSESSRSSTRGGGGGGESLTISSRVDTSGCRGGAIKRSVERSVPNNISTSELRRKHHQIHVTVQQDAPRASYQTEQYARERSSSTTTSSRRRQVSPDRSEQRRHRDEPPPRRAPQEQPSRRRGASPPEPPRRQEGARRSEEPERRRLFDEREQLAHIMAAKDMYAEQQKIRAEKALIAFQMQQLEKKKLEAELQIAQKALLMQQAALGGGGALVVDGGALVAGGGAVGYHHQEHRSSYGGGGSSSNGGSSNRRRQTRRSPSPPQQHHSSSRRQRRDSGGAGRYRQSTSSSNSNRNSNSGGRNLVVTATTTNNTNATNAGRSYGIQSVPDASSYSTNNYQQRSSAASAYDLQITATMPQAGAANSGAAYHQPYGNVYQHNTAAYPVWGGLDAQGHMAMDTNWSQNAATPSTSTSSGGGGGQQWQQQSYGSNQHQHHQNNNSSQPSSSNRRGNDYGNYRGNY
ncbi:Pharyngeal muscle protein 2 [Caenorhabditis elegans]|uniref:Isoform b of Pharyngeal muscle protein 2 n=1 Tax=Caenorhabditis elegans TaxID=6239 RepID=O62203-2|nr:Pharyngeal muscle protein 2 [Caenorhabditis elegans]CAD98731.1 Pharyngeal muscle protein 2 [Caenorhabditis elegans]|eukprot:NP_001021441.1 Uncharacterized protein CELE_F32B4.4 [Caenorhabditis elegans]